MFVITVSILLTPVCVCSNQYRSNKQIGRTLVGVVYLHIFLYIRLTYWTFPSFSGVQD
jgi:hypothetical protein